MWQLTPRASRADHVKDRIHHPAPRMPRGTPTRPRRGHQRLDQLPLGIGQVGRITLVLRPQAHTDNSSHISHADTPNHFPNTFLTNRICAAISSGYRVHPALTWQISRSQGRATTGPLPPQRNVNQKTPRAGDSAIDRERLERAGAEVSSTLEQNPQHDR